MKLEKALLTTTIIATTIYTAWQTATAELATASVTIVTSPIITRDADLNFGEVIPSTGGSIILNTDGTRTAFGSLLGPVDGNAAQLTIDGGIGASYTVSFPPNTTLSGPGDDMTVSAFTTNASGFLTTGTETFSIGGELYVNPNQAAGTYSGTFDVDVVYN